jgi:hypothetical protein
MPKIDLSMLNQRQTPAFYADVLANRPAAGFIGRIFVSTDTYAFYRDNGTSWDLIGGPGTGTITGSGAVNQIAYWNGASTITGDNELYYDSASNYLGVGTNAPGAAIDAHSAVNVIQQLNQTVATNNSLLAFQNAGAGLWRIGNFYNAGANDYGVYDVIGAAQPFTIKKTTGQVLIGTSTVGSGKLVVSSATSDNGVQIVGASAPSLRIDNAESGPTKRAGLGISTAANNFIQGSVDRDFCMFNGSTTASPILFGIYGTTNVQEAARISAARNFLIGTTTDAGYKLDVNGAGRFTGVVYADNTIRVANAIIGTNSNNLLLSSNTTGGEISFWNGQLANRLMTLTGAGLLGLGTSTPSVAIEVAGNSNLSTRYRAAKSGSGTIEMGADRDTTNSPYISAFTNSNLDFFTNDTFRLRITSGGNTLIGTTTDAGQKLQVNGTSLFSGNVSLSNGNNITGNSSISIPLNLTNYQILSYAFFGLVVIRDISFGGSGVFLLDPNAGALLISSNLGYVLTFTFAAGVWQVQKSTGGSTTINFLPLQA